MTDVPSQPSPTEPTAAASESGVPSSRPRFDWGAFAAHLTTFFSVVIVLGLAIGFLLLRAPVRQKAEAVVAKGPVTIRFEWPELKRPEEDAAGKGTTKPVAQTNPRGGTAKASPQSSEPTTRERPRTWLAPQFQEELMTLAYKALGSDPDPLSREPLDAIGAAMEASGWFDGRPSVLRGEAQEIVIRGNWRIPAAVVRFSFAQPPGGPAPETKDYLISWDARPMPVVYPEGKSGLLVIRGVASGPGKDAGGNIDYRAAWQGEDVEAGLELLRTLMHHPWRSQVAGIDVTDYASTRQLVIETIHQTRLIWGGRPSKPLAGECSTRAKLGKINDLVAYTKRIDGEKSEIEIWWPINKTLEIDRTASKPAGTSGEATANAETPNR